MKNNLENSFKESFNNFEMPYNSAAWKNMRAKLDTKMPVKPTKNKWFVAAGILIIATLTTSLFLFSNKENSQKTVVAKTSQETTPNNRSNNTPENNSRSVNDNRSETTSTDDVIVETIEPKEITNNDNEEQIATQSNDVKNELENTTSSTEQSNDVNRLEKLPSQSPEKEKKTVTPENLIIPTIASVCIGEEIEIKNINDAEIVVGGPWFKQIIEPHSTLTVTFKNEGTYVIGPEEADDGKNLKTFSVAPLPTPDFFIDSDVKYENGLPSIRLISNSGQNTVWKFEKTSLKGDEINPHFFKKGNHIVEISIEGANGCANSLEKNVYIEDNYNLLAVNSFIPHDNDIRRNTFMPFALTQRKDVRFTMIIIDPTDGHTVFQTNDATNGWTGIDQQTGQEVQQQKAYIWKVIISNPVQGEDGEYAGTITPLKK